LVAWLPVAVVATVLAATCYAMAQQLTRSGADDGPRALAQRAADSLARGDPPAQVAPAVSVDLATDLGPFITVYDAAGAVQASTALLDGVPLALPQGVLAEARTHGSDRVTWQPRAGVREAVIALPWRSASARGVVVAGASLQPAEEREDQLLLLLLAGWLVAMAGSLAATGIGAIWLGSGRTGRSGV